MSKGIWFQCQSCGSLHKADVEFDIDELFIELRCNCCRGSTKHLWVGEKEDVYLYGNVNLDKRYYEYNTK